jgi:hypothetical protein
LTSTAANDSDGPKVQALAGALLDEVRLVPEVVAGVASSFVDARTRTALCERITATLQAYMGSAERVIGRSSNSSYVLIFMGNAQLAFDRFSKEGARLTSIVEQEKLDVV